MSGSSARADSKSPPRRERIESKRGRGDGEDPREKHAVSSRPSPQDDVALLHASLGSGGSSNEEAVAELHKTVDQIFEEEEQLLNLHMSTIQESAELLTEEGKLLQEVQGHEDYEIDEYASQLEAILNRKTALVEQLSAKLKAFRKSLAKEELLSRQVSNMPAY